MRHYIICIDKWFTGNNSFDKTCINCRHEQAITQTCHLQGMDSLLTLVSTVLEAENYNDDEEEEELM